jgi:short-subunit dehydrogenase
VSLPAPNPDHTILITGASAGIGTELARQLAERGHNVVLVARREERLRELAEELRSEHGVKVDVRPSDLADADARRDLVKKLKAARKNVVAVCNNAGFGSFGLFQELDLDWELNEVRLNVEAMHELTGAFLPEMIERGEGAILNVGSVAGFQPQPSNATYAATKAFVNSFSEAIHTDLAGTGVSCTVLCPGPVATEFGESAGVAEQEAQLPAAVVQSAAEVARAGIEGMLRGRRTVFPGVVPRALALGGHYTPRSVLLPVWGKIARNRLAGTEKKAPR